MATGSIIAAWAACSPGRDGCGGHVRAQHLVVDTDDPEGFGDDYWLNADGYYHLVLPPARALKAHVQPGSADRYKNEERPCGHG
jgi:hypothetical protein